MNFRDLALRECIAALNVCKTSTWVAFTTASPEDRRALRAEYDQCRTAVEVAEAALNQPQMPEKCMWAVTKGGLTLCQPPKRN